MAKTLRRAFCDWMSLAPVVRVTRWLIYAVLAALTACLILMIVMAVLALSESSPEPVIGPTPEEIQVHCQPVIDWIVAEIEKSGTPPGQISSEHAALLDELPYSWDLEGSILRIGELEALGGEWPHPLYQYQWSARGWSGGGAFRKGSPGRVMIEEHCRPVTDWLQSEMKRCQRLPEHLPDEHTARLNELPNQWSYNHLGLRIGDAADELLHSCFWSPRQWSWWADDPISNEEARRILEEHGYYR